MLKTTQLASARQARIPIALHGSLDEVARRLNEICRNATLDLSYRVGQYLIEALYGGSLADWAREGTRRPSYRQLAARGDLMLSASALCRSVAIYQLCESMGGRTTLRHLSCSHLQEVLPLEPLARERLLRIAEAEAWSVARLRAEVSKRLPPRRARRRVPALIRTLLRLSTMLATQAEGQEDAFDIDRLEDEKRGQLAEAMSVLRERITTLESSLRRESLAPERESRVSLVRELAREVASGSG